mgnify:CR=1 FL=1
MYFVTVRQPGYVLFAMTPSELGAVALAEDQQTVRLLRRAALGEAWESFAEWKSSELTHSDFMAAMQNRDEPATPAELLDVLPAALRDQVRS